MGLFSFLFGTFKGMEEHIDNKDKKKRESEISDSNLEDWQIEEVKKGNYDTFNFEEDAIEDEDDYYHEDD